MKSLLHLVQQTLADLNGRPIILAYSGGVDSQVLLEILFQLQQQQKITSSIEVCHVNHGLSANAMQWQHFAKQQCQQRNLPLTIHQLKITRQNQQSLEQLAREARYQVFNQQAEKLEQAMVLTGHHQDDQAETFLLALKRGAGIKGLAAMQKVTQRKNFLLVRPLLNISRQTIVDFAQAYQLTWVEDESNLDESFDRNFIRHQVMPLLTQRWPAIKTTISRSSAHCQEAQSILNDMAQNDLQHCWQSQKDNILSIPALKQLSLPRFNNILRYFIAQQTTLMPSSEQLKQVYQQINAEGDKSPAVKLATIWLRRYRDGLYLTPDFSDLSRYEKLLNIGNISSNIDAKQRVLQVSLPDNLGLLTVEKIPVFQSTNKNEMAPFAQVIFIKAPQVDEQVYIRFAHNNPLCLPDYRQHHRPLKKILQELNIPPWQRKRIAFLYYNDTLVAALGYFVCKPYLAVTGHKALKISY